MDRGRDPFPKISASTSNLRGDISADETFAEQVDLSVNKYEFIVTVMVSWRFGISLLSRKNTI